MRLSKRKEVILKGIVELPSQSSALGLHTSPEHRLDPWSENQDLASSAAKESKRHCDCKKDFLRAK